MVVDQVTVGDLDVTPTGKWFQFYTDGTYQGGNGGVINIRGRYVRDDEKEILVMMDSLGNEDPEGPFKYSYSNAGEIWERKEEGESVTVRLSLKEDMPMAPWDMLVGLWRKSASEAEGPDRIFFRWDREYRMFLPDGSEAGVWQIHGHQSMLRMFSFSQQGQLAVFTFKFHDGGQLLQMEKEGVVWEYVRASMN